jgi:K+/H+ antiporter YhaU regulatory subunit KhtT
VGTNPAVMKNRGQQPSVLQQKRSHEQCVTLLTCDQQEKKKLKKIKGRLAVFEALDREGSSVF